MQYFCILLSSFDFPFTLPLFDLIVTYYQYLNSILTFLFSLWLDSFFLVLCNGWNASYFDSMATDNILYQYLDRFIFFFFLLFLEYIPNPSIDSNSYQLLSLMGFIFYLFIYLSLFMFLFVHLPIFLLYISIYQFWFYAISNFWCFFRQASWGLRARLNKFRLLWGLSSPMMQGALGGVWVAHPCWPCDRWPVLYLHSIVRKQYGRNDCLEGGCDQIVSYSTTSGDIVTHYLFLRCVTSWGLFYFIHVFTDYLRRAYP